MSFTPIETQEDLDRIIGERLKREREATEKKYADYDAVKEKADKYDALAKEHQEQIEKLQTDLQNATDKIAGHEQVVSDLKKRAADAETANLKHRIAHEANIPFELAGRLTGSTEEELRKDAETLGMFVGQKTTAPPLFTGETGTGMLGGAGIDAYVGILDQLIQ